LRIKQIIISIFADIVSWVAFSLAASAVPHTREGMNNCSDEIDKIGNNSIAEEMFGVTPKSTSERAGLCPG